MPIPPRRHIPRVVYVLTGKLTSLRDNGSQTRMACLASRRIVARAYHMRHIPICDGTDSGSRTRKKQFLGLLRMPVPPCPHYYIHFTTVSPFCPFCQTNHAYETAEPICFILSKSPFFAHTIRSENTYTFRGGVLSKSSTRRRLPSKNVSFKNI